MEKKEYVSPEIEVVVFSAEEMSFLTGSSCGNIGCGVYNDTDGCINGDDCEEYVLYVHKRIY